MGFALLYIYSHGEQYCFLFPSIDTVYAKNFSDNGFKRIECGMSKEEVLKIVGNPLEITRYKNEEIYFYSKDGACHLGGFKYADFAWIEYSVIFKDELVIDKNKKVFYD